MGSAAADPESASPDEPTEYSTDVAPAEPDSEQPATDIQEPADSVPPEQPTAAAATTQQQHSVESSSNAYWRAVIPNIESLLAENDFSDVDARKR